MSPLYDEKQIAIKLNERVISSLDGLAKNGSTNRSHLMLSLINIWISVLENVPMAGLFYITSLLRSRVQLYPGYPLEFTESRLPEKPLPLKLSDSTIETVLGLASVNRISRHQLLKVMIIVGMEELEDLTDRTPFEFGAIEQQLHKSFTKLMEKGFKAFKAFSK